MGMGMGMQLRTHSGKSFWEPILGTQFGDALLEHNPATHFEGAVHNAKPTKMYNDLGLTVDTFTKNLIS